MNKAIITLLILCAFAWEIPIFGAQPLLNDDDCYYPLEEHKTSGKKITEAVFIELLKKLNTNSYASLKGRLKSYLAGKKCLKLHTNLSVYSFLTDEIVCLLCQLFPKDLEELYLDCRNLTNKPISRILNVSKDLKIFLLQWYYRSNYELYHTSNNEKVDEKLVGAISQHTKLKELWLYDFNFIKDELEPLLDANQELKIICYSVDAIEKDVEKYLQDKYNDRIIFTDDFEDVLPSSDDNCIFL